MPRKDMFHDIVKEALIADDWIITHDPLHTKYGGAEIFVDLGAKKLIGATKDGQNIAVEVKSFVGASHLHDFHQAVGQFVNYRLILKHTHPDHKLYLAIPTEIYYALLDTQFGREAQAEHQLRILVVDDRKKVVALWISSV